MAERVGYIDMIGGASGDMLLGALIDAGVPLDALKSEIGRCIASGYSLRTEKVRRGAIDATLLRVDLDSEGDRVRAWDEFDLTIAGSTLPDNDKESARSVFTTLRRAEAEAHADDTAHLHELGSVDTLVDIIGAVVAIRLLGITRLHASPFPTGAGMSKSSHGAAAGTAPATQRIYLSKFVPVRTAGAGYPPGEAVTPTGAAIIATLANFRPTSFALARIGYGAGQRDPAGFPNVLGLWVGEQTAVELQEPVTSLTPRSEARRLTLLETNIDDMPGEVFGFVQERLFALGVLDVWFTPIQMKKNRPGVLLSALVASSQATDAARLILRETSTLGIRVRQVERIEAQRRVVDVSTSLGLVPVKVKELDGEILDASPEYEACRDVALRTGLALQEVMRRVQADAMTLLSRGRGADQ